MEKSPLKRQKTLLEKEKLLITSYFSFSHSVFKRLLLQSRKNKGLFGKGLNNAIWVLMDAHFLRLAHRNRKAGLPKLSLLCPLGRNCNCYYGVKIQQLRTPRSI